jgi:hypothetical protein
MREKKICKLCMPNLRCVAEEKGRMVIDFLLDETNFVKKSISECSTFKKRKKSK